MDNNDAREHERMNEARHDRIERHLEILRKSVDAVLTQIDLLGQNIEIVEETLDGVSDHVSGGAERPWSFLRMMRKLGIRLPRRGSFPEYTDDELYTRARAAVIEAGKASTSYLQRRFGIGYSRAARLIDVLEERSVIGPGLGAKPREVLIKEDEHAEK